MPYGITRMPHGITRPYWVNIVWQPNQPDQIVPVQFSRRAARYKWGTRWILNTTWCSIAGGVYRKWYIQIEPRLHTVMSFMDISCDALNENGVCLQWLLHLATLHQGLDFKKAEYGNTVMANIWNLNWVYTEIERSSHWQNFIRWLYQKFPNDNF